MAKAFDFKEQLALGHQAEEDFLNYYPNALAVSEDLRWDFLDVTNGKKIELKADSYDPVKFPNFIMERYSDTDRQTPGGPWRARKDRLDVFIYFFSQTGQYWEFHDIKGLCAALDKLTPQCKEIKIRNKSWVTTAFQVPRGLVAHLGTEFKLNKGET